MSLRGLLIVAATGALALPAQAQTPDSGAFIIRLGRDTLGVERYVRTGQQLISEVAYRVPQTRELKLTVTYNDKGEVAWYEAINNRVTGVPQAAPMTRTVLTNLGDSAMIQIWIDAVPQAQKMVAARKDMVPISVPFFSTFEAIFQKARKLGMDTTTAWSLSGESAAPFPLQGLLSTQPMISVPGSGLVVARVDANGRVVEFDGDQSTFKVDVVRSKWLDLAPFYKRWAKIDSVGKSMGYLSPRDTIDADIGETNVWIDYSRPLQRGRVIFGKVVPFGKIWRTGANAATQIEISTPMKFNGVRVEAGRYSLWTIPDRTSWTLIINKQTKQWGTEYDAKKDLLRIPIKTEVRARPVDRFTIEVRQTSPGIGVMSFNWEKTKAYVLLEAAK